MPGSSLPAFLRYAESAWVSRALLVLLPLLLALSVAANHRQSLVDCAYPVPSAASAAPFSASVTPTPARPIEARSYEGAGYIGLPLRYSGVSEGYAVVTADFKFTLTAADGSQWTSPWQQTQDHIRPSARHTA